MPAIKPGLIITADDYGLHPNINRGIIAAVRGGIVSSVHVMANLVTKDEVKELQDAIHESGDVCGIGLHLNTTWGGAIIQKSATFKHSWDHDTHNPEDDFYSYRDLNTYAHNRTNFDEIKKEMVEQFVRLAGMVGGGKNIDAISSHYNIHFWDSNFLNIIYSIADAQKIPVRSPIRIDGDLREPKVNKYQNIAEQLLESAIRTVAKGLSGGTGQLMLTATKKKKLLEYHNLLTENWKLPSPRNMCGYWFGQPDWKVMEWFMTELKRLNAIVPGYNSELFMHLSDSPDGNDHRWDYSMQKRYKEFQVVNTIDFAQKFNKWKTDMGINHGSYRNILQS